MLGLILLSAAGFAVGAGARGRRDRQRIRRGQRRATVEKMTTNASSYDSSCTTCG